MTEIKNSLDGLNSKREGQRKGTATKIEQQKLNNKNTREKK